MDTEELFVHDGGDRERAERVDAGIVNLLRVFSSAYSPTNQLKKINRHWWTKVYMAIWVR